MSDVSIIIPVYNRSNLFRETLISCCQQTYKDLEIIVIDDGSEEDIVSVIKELSFTYRILDMVKYVRQERLGGNVARNRGVREAHGDFIQFLDSDDLIHPEKIELQRKFLLNRPDLDMVFSLDQYFRVTPGDMGELWNMPNELSDLDRFLWDDPVWHTGSPLWRRDALSIIGDWDESLICWQDWEFHIKAISKGIRYDYLPLILQYIRDHNQLRSTNLESLLQREKSKIRAGELVYTYLSYSGLINKSRRNSLAFFLFERIETLIELNEFDLVCDILIKAYRFVGDKRFKLMLISIKKVLDLMGLEITKKLYTKIIHLLRRLVHKYNGWKRVYDFQGLIPESLLPLSKRNKDYTSLRISVIIPTYNRSNLLPMCLDSLMKQSYPKTNFEVIIIDNNSQDNTKEVVNKYIYDYPDVNIRYLLEKRPGLVYARHAGAKAARFEILAFSDDDGILAPEWLMEIAKVFNINEQIAAVAGKIIVRWDQIPPEWVIPYESLLGKLDYGHRIRVGKRFYINGGNFTIKKNVLYELGGFNPDQIGDWLIGDGETGLCRKIHKAGMLIGWNPKALMEHYQVVKKNATIQDIKRRFINNGRSVPYRIYVVDKKGFQGLLLNLPWVFLKIIYWQINKVLYFLCRRDQKYLAAIFETSYYCCQIPYTFKLLFNKNFRELIQQSNWF